MYFLVLAVIVILILYRIMKRENDKTFHRDLIPKSICEKIVETSKKYEFMVKPEVVDGKPMGEIALYKDSKPENIELWNLCKQYYFQLAQKHNLQINYAFLRRYNTGDRNDLIMHLDDEIDAPTTINVLLSDTDDFEGGELYIFNKNNTAKILNQYGGDLDINQRAQFIKDCPKMPMLNLKQGDAVYYVGSELIHGVLPITSGERYVLGFFSTFVT
jgi:hypothetical protein|tara:strand:- start:1989 stop:2636 length:648 start_codon:yes stop_codon:yes gene_type:complete